LSFVVMCLMAASAPAAEPASISAARDLLAFQRDAWNRADIDAFMDGYWRSDDLRFAGGDTYVTGWQAAIDRYRKAYPDAASMGRLDFDLVEVRELSPDAVYVFGRWALERAQDKPGRAPHGVFTLIVERKDGRWVVTRDHTSSAE
jgi:uncharacterized protein (TIGR02246 family)